jgi:pSer/pThr/pTyr-binding forkhead associated (FHA) protein
LAPAPANLDLGCPRCGATTGRGLSFCGSCGFDLSGRHSLVPRNPTTARQARLVVIAQDGSPGRRYELPGAAMDIGASDGDILLPNDPFISPRHARLLRNNNRFWVRDLDSVNGIYIRLQRPHILEHGDLLLIGLEVLRFELLKGNEAGFGHAMERGIQLFGSPIAPRYAKLCQRTVEGVTRDVYHLCREETVIGREGGDLIFASDPFMSRRHASISRDPHSKVFTVRDLGSSNGTFLAIRGEVEVNHGDLIRIGQHLFRFELE